MPKSEKLSLFVFIDAFGWEILKTYPFLDSILVEKHPLQTVLGYTSTCIPTILTGKSPQEHGHFSFFYYDPHESPFRLCRLLSFLPNSLTKRGRVRRLLSRIIGRFYGYKGYFQIYNMPFRYLNLFDYSEKKDLFEKEAINNGFPTIFEDIWQKKIPFHRSNWRASEEQNIYDLKQTLTSGKIRAAYLHLAAMDGILHQFSYPAPQVEAKIRWYEQELQQLFEFAQEVYQEVRLFCFSDHGMTPVIEFCDLKTRIEKLGLVFGQDYVAVYDSTMARFWFLKEFARSIIVETLQKEPQGEILSTEQLKQFECNFSQQKYGDLFFLINPGVLICPSFMGETVLAGMHGYDPADKNSVAIFASNVSKTPPKNLKALYSFIQEEIVS
jgi:predicted AlkP superfamily pyrophosphatase or phosphodiesterase